MTYDHKVISDGMLYEAGEEVPDLGTIKATDVKGNERSYEGYSTDLDKLKYATTLPQYDDLATGSSVLLQDTSEVYKYEATTREWSRL